MTASCLKASWPVAVAMPSVARARIIRPCNSAISARRRLDRVFDRADLGGDLKCGGLNHLFAHGMLPLERRSPEPLLRSKGSNLGKAAWK